MMRLIDDSMAWLIGKRCLWRLSVIAFSMALWGANIAIGCLVRDSLLLGMFVGYLSWSIWWGVMLVWPKIVEDLRIIGHPESGWSCGLPVWAASPWLLLAIVIGPLGGGIFAFLAYFFETFLGKDESGRQPSGD